MKNNKRIQHLMDIVTYKRKTYYISTNDTPDHGLETMVFKCKRKIKNIEELKEVNDDVVDWCELYAERYETTNEAIKKHYEIVKNLNEYIER